MIALLLFFYKSLVGVHAIALFWRSDCSCLSCLLILTFFGAVILKTVYIDLFGGYYSFESRIFTAVLPLLAVMLGIGFSQPSIKHVQELKESPRSSCCSPTQGEMLSDTQEERLTARDGFHLSASSWYFFPFIHFAALVFRGHCAYK